MTLQRRVLSSEPRARRWMTRQVGPSAGTLSTPRGSVQTVRIRKDVGDRTALWRAPSSGSRSTRIPKTQEQARDGRRQIAIAEARARGRIGERLHGARIGIVGTETAVTAGGRAETGEETDEGTTVVANVRDVGAAKETVRGVGAVKETVLLEAMGISERRDQSEQISKGCLEPQPWARLTMGRLRAQAVGTLLEARKPAELSKPLPVTVMRDPKAKVASLFQDVASPAR